MTAVKNDHLKPEMDIAFSGLPARELDRLSCIHTFCPIQLKNWCDQLNVLNVATAAPLMSNIFQELAAARLSVQEIFDLYQVTCPALGKVREAAYTLYSQKRLQLTTQARQAMELAHGLDRAVILMLKAILVENLNQPQAAKIEDLTATIGSHIFIFLSELYVRLNEFSLQMPKGFWRECHSLYWRLSKYTSRALDVQIFTFREYPEALSPGDLYKALVLYSMLEPAKYDRNLQFCLFQMMLRLAPQMVLDDEPKSSQPFAVVMTQDLSVVPRRVLGEANRAGVLYLNADKIVSTLMNRSNVETTLTHHPVLVNLNQVFVEAITVEQYRKETRAPLAQHAQCFFGLVQIHQFLMASDSIADAVSSAEEEQDFYAQKNMSQTKVHSEELNIKDASLGGYCLETLQKHRLGYGSGDLLFMIAQDVDIMCVIRWVRLQASGCFLLGVEKLATNTSAIEFVIVPESADSAREKGLKFELDHQQMMLSRVAIQQGQTICIIEKNQRQSYAIGDVHWLVSGYVQTVLLE